jgi:hypothetical protein
MIVSMRIIKELKYAELRDFIRNYQEPFLSVACRKRPNLGQV